MSVMLVGDRNGLDGLLALLGGDDDIVDLFRIRNAGRLRERRGFAGQRQRTYHAEPKKTPIFHAIPLYRRRCSHIEQSESQPASRRPFSIYVPIDKQMFRIDITLIQPDHRIGKRQGWQRGVYGNDGS
jgi:hypothetical protein